MSHFTACIAGGLILASGLQAGLVPKDFCDEPPIRRLTATWIKGDTLPFSESEACQGLACDCRRLTDFLLTVWPPATKP